MWPSEALRQNLQYCKGYSENRKNSDALRISAYIFSNLTFFQNLEAELNELQTSLYNLNNMLVELSHVCGESIMYELDQDAKELNGRYGNVKKQVAERKERLKKIITTWQHFHKDCDDMLSWIDYQSDIIDHNDEGTLVSDLEQLKQCQVRFRICSALQNKTQ